jgi:hypothetical protein
MFRHSLIPLALSLGLTLGTGCAGKSRATTTVSGQVTYRGAPVTVGVIYFHGPDDQVAMGTIAVDGTFTATDVPVGAVRVSLQVRDPGVYGQQLGKGAANPPGKTGTDPVRVTSVPAKFADPQTSGVRYVIEPGMTNLEVKLE